jgi:flagellar protein FliO/FliZ
VTVNEETVSNAPEIGSAVNAISGMETLAKTGVSLLLILALILVLSYLLRKLNHAPRQSHRLLKQIASASLGPRERIVVMEINSTWLVLGVSGSAISKLHECPAVDSDTAAVAADAQASPFAARLAGFLRPTGPSGLTRQDG